MGTLHSRGLSFSYRERGLFFVWLWSGLRHATTKLSRGQRQQSAAASTSTRIHFGCVSKRKKCRPRRLPHVRCITRTNPKFLFVRNDHHNLIIVLAVPSHTSSVNFLHRTAIPKSEIVCKTSLPEKSPIQHPKSLVDMLQ